MKKSKIKLLSVAACLALVGTASAAWAYAGTASASASIGVKVAAYADAGTITVSGANNIKLYLDKGEVKFIKEDETIPLTATYNGPEDIENYTVTRSWRADISHKLDGYVDFKNSTGTDSRTYCEFKTLGEWSDSVDLFDSLPEMCWSYCSSLSGYWGEVMDEANYKNLIGYTDTDSDWDEEKSKEHYRQSEYEFDVYLTFTATIEKKSS